jgi:hypothetical protein
MGGQSSLGTFGIAIVLRSMNEMIVRILLFRLNEMIVRILFLARGK